MPCFEFGRHWVNMYECVCHFGSSLSQTGRQPFGFRKIAPEWDPSTLWPCLTSRRSLQDWLTVGNGARPCSCGGWFWWWCVTPPTELPTIQMPDLATDCARCTQGRGGVSFLWLGIWSKQAVLVQDGVGPADAGIRRLKLASPLLFPDHVSRLADCGVGREAIFWAAWAGKVLPLFARGADTSPGMSS